MKDGKIVVPEGAAEYATREMWTSETMMFRMPINEPWFSSLTKELGQLSAKGVALWLMENPIVPTDAQIDRILAFAYATETGRLAQARYELTEWQRRMFLAPESEVPEAVRELLRMDIMGDWVQIHAAIIEAYKRGLKAAPHVD